MSFIVKLDVVSLVEKATEIVESFDAEPLDTVDDDIVIDGLVLSYVQLNCDAAVLLFPAISVNEPAFTSIVVAPSPDGLNRAV